MDKGYYEWLTERVIVCGVDRASPWEAHEFNQKAIGAGHYDCAENPKDWRFTQEALDYLKTKAYNESLINTDKE